MCFFQFLGWKALTSQSIFFASKDNVSGSFVYALTGLHLAHLIGGVIFLLFVCYRSIANKYNQQSYLGIRQCATYWHFLDLLWVILFVFLTVLR
ncbi:MAG: cytochrome c oxidase subunit 3 [Bacteroidetes bacterium]|nr:cytochrome c oxidase subunit 3 [Bacteroidota bacterium]